MDKNLIQSTKIANKSRKTNIQNTYLYIFTRLKTTLHHFLTFITLSSYNKMYAGETETQKG